MNGFDKGLLVFVGGLLISGVWLRSVVMPMRGLNVQEILIIDDGNGQVIAPAAPAELPCEQEQIIL
jgi:hypothetical protein